MKKEKCLFCDIVSNNINCYKVFENEFVLAFLDISPISRGHTLVITKEHYDTYLDMNPLESANYFKYVNIIAKHIKNKLNCNGLTLLVNIGKEAGQEIMHQHVHIIPKWNDYNLIYQDFSSIKKDMNINKNYFFELVKQLH